MPQSEVNAPAHLQDRKIKENLNYRVLLTLKQKLFIECGAGKVALFSTAGSAP